MPGWKLGKKALPLAQTSTGVFGTACRMETMAVPAAEAGSGAARATPTEAPVATATVARARARRIQTP